MSGVKGVLFMRIVFFRLFTSFSHLPLDPEVVATGCIFLLILETNDMRKALIILLILDTG